MSRPQGLRGFSCLTVGNELSEETHVLTKQESLLGRGAWPERESEGSQEDPLPCGSQSQVLR